MRRSHVTGQFLAGLGRGIGVRVTVTVTVTAMAKGLGWVHTRTLIPPERDSYPACVNSLPRRDPRDQMVRGAQS